MQKFILGVLPAYLLATQSSFAQEEARNDRLNIGLSVQQLWDSNYSRTPEEESEEITLTGASIGLNHRISRQQFKANWQGLHYEHAERVDLDSTLNKANLVWNGEWGSRLKSELEWVRDSYLVDRLEFFGKDIVKRDDVNAKLGYGAGHKLMLAVGGRDTRQTHTNGEREGLDFDEEEVFVEAGYKTGIKSTIIARVKYGERIYPNEQLITPPPGVEPLPENIPGDGLLTPGYLDYDYGQAELEVVWVASEKTSITSTLGYFERDGLINSGDGALAGIEINWELTPKVALAGGYSLRQPAIGETSDSPSDIHRFYFDATWQWTEKLSLSAGARFYEFHYENASPGLIRDESLVDITPLAINFAVAESFSLKLKTSWTDRDSPLTYRDYSSEQVSIGAFFSY
jgi:hypothetical protein